MPAQFSEQDASPNGEQAAAPENCTFQWVEELPKRAERGHRGTPKKEWLNTALARLSERPGVWAMILSYSSASTASSRSGSLKKMFPQLEFTSRKTGEKGAAVYARVPVPPS